VPSNLQEWLTHISRVHPREIELGLGRVQRVAQDMSLSKSFKVITVAGTNGKGSVVSVMENLLCHAGISVGAYTSPHLHCFNERIRLQGLPCDEGLICEAFSEIDAIRGEVSLSYFEFATLAALWIFRRKRVSIALLEVGLGGRLDAVNILDPDVSVITAMGRDRQDWLGDSREEIGLEKAGILRHGGNFVCGDPDPPLSVIRKARELSCISLYQGREFGLRTDEQSEETQWWGVRPDGSGLCAAFPAATAVLPVNVSTALQALASAGAGVDLEQAADIIAVVRPPGRQELTKDRMTGVPVMLDVAHNPDSIDALIYAVQRLRQPVSALDHRRGTVRLVMAVMADKDVESMLASLVSIVDIWYIAQVEDARCLPSIELSEKLKKLDPTSTMRCFNGVAEAYKAACEDALAQAAEVEREMVVVAGSFHTVAAARMLSKC